MRSKRSTGERLEVRPAEAVAAGAAAAGAGTAGAGAAAAGGGNTAACDRVTARLPAIVDGTAVADPSVLAHVEGCLRCQAELVQYRKLLKALHQLRTQLRQPAPGLLGDLLVSLEEAGERRAIRGLLAGRRGAYLGGIAAATAAGAAGAIVLAARRQRRVRLAG